MICCDDIWPLGCVDSCADIDLKFSAEMDGPHKFVVEFAGSNIEQTADFTTGQRLKFTNIYNEQYTHVGKLFDPNGTVVSCFSFTTTLTIKRP